MIVINAPGYVPFEPRTDEQRALRAELRRGLRTMEAGWGEILWATFAGRLPRGADVENALFYNLAEGRTFAHSIDNGVGFELNPQPPVSGVRYTYELVPSTNTFACWQAERELATLSAELPRAPTLASIWWALRATPGSIKRGADERRSDEPFALTLDIAGPTFRLNPVMIKTVLDGVICGLQSQTDRASAATLAPLIARGLDVSAEAVANALTSADQSAIGVRPRLVHARGNGVQWTPDDDHCVAARLLFTPADHWQVNGAATVIARTSI